jgi:hypothetical protein
MTAAAELVSRGRSAGVELFVGPGGGSLVWEAASDPPADLLAELARHKLDVIALLRGSHGNCNECGRALDKESRCWRCCNRLCVDCGRWTVSAFIQRSVTCGFRHRDE